MAADRRIAIADKLKRVPMGFFKTILIIAHRLKTVRRADQILVVDQGRIVQRGTHAQLIDQPGIYADFVGGRKETEGWKI